MHPIRPNQWDVFRQGATGVLLVFGLVVTCCSGILMATFAGGGVYRGTFTREPITNKITDAGSLNWVPVTFVFFCLGILLIVGALGYGFFVSATERQGPRRAMPGKVLARYAVNRQGHMLVAEWEIEAADRPKYYVRMDFGPQVGSTELECVEPVFYQCGEGMRGTAEVQGKWLGAFHPDTGASYQSEHRAHL